MPTVRIKRSTVTGHTPTLLLDGQVCINQKDWIFFWPDETGATQSFNFKTPSITAPSVDDNSAKVPTTSWVMGQLSGTSPLVNGSASAGTSTRVSRQDHVHPTDTSRAPINGPNFTGTATIQTNPPQDANSQAIASTSWVDNQLSTSNPLGPGTAAPGTSLRHARADHVHPLQTGVVQQGTGVNQGANQVKIGWGTGPYSGKVAVTIDTTDLGAIALESWVAANYYTQATISANYAQLSYLNGTFTTTANLNANFPTYGYLFGNYWTAGTTQGQINASASSVQSWASANFYTKTVTDAAYATYSYVNGGTFATNANLSSNYWTASTTSTQITNGDNGVINYANALANTRVDGVRFVFATDNGSPTSSGGGDVVGNAVVTQIWTPDGSTIYQRMRYLQIEIGGIWYTTGFAS